MTHNHIVGYHDGYQQKKAADPMVDVSATKIIEEPLARHSEETADKVKANSDSSYSGGLMDSVWKKLGKSRAPAPVV